MFNITRFVLTTNAERQAGYLVVHGCVPRLGLSCHCVRCLILQVWHLETEIVSLVVDIVQSPLKGVLGFELQVFLV